MNELNFEFQTTFNQNCESVNSVIQKVPREFVSNLAVQSIKNVGLKAVN